MSATSRHRSGPPRPPPRSRRGSWFLLVSILGAPLLIPMGFWLLQPWPGELRDRFPERTSFMEYRLRQATARGEELELRYRPVPLDSISPQLRRLVLAAEDDRFRQHHGFDWEAIAEETRYSGSIPPRLRDPEDRAALLAALRYLGEHAGELRGRSTLTQQLAKNLYLTPERSWVRKARETILTRRLEKALGKDRILELYLNVAEWGPGVFGAEAASQHYFGKPAGSLTRFEAATLAATLPHPLTSNPRLNPGRMEWRRTQLLQRLEPPPPPAPLPIPPVDPLQHDSLEEPPQGRRPAVEDPYR